MTTKKTAAARAARLALVFSRFASHFCTRERGGCKGMGGETCTDCRNRALAIADSDLL